MSDPLTPSECDLRGMEWMPLYGDRLLSSETWLMASAEGRCAALQLWWAAWKQCPAGSLADQDRVLAQLAGYGLGVKAWLAIKDEALRGWIKCVDGRLYHPVLCELALEAWDRRRKERARKEAWRAKRDSGNGGTEPSEDADGDGDKTGTETGTRPSQNGHGDVSVRVEQNRQDRTGQEKEERKKEPPAALPGCSPPKPSTRGSRLATNWEPGPDERREAIAQGLDPERVADRFRDYWVAVPGAKGVKADWAATWRNWCRRDVEQLPATKSKPLSKLGFLDKYDGPIQ